MGNVYTVSQVTSYIKNMFTQDFALNRISIKGKVFQLQISYIRPYLFYIKGRRRTDCRRHVCRTGKKSGFSFDRRTGSGSVRDCRCI